MTSMVSLLLVFMLTIGNGAVVNPGNAGANLNINPKPCLGENFQNNPTRTDLSSQKQHVLRLFSFQEEKSCLAVLYYYRNRYYLPRVGRFLQTDPLGYQDSMNLYQAFNLNPVNFVDPFGTIIYKSDYKAIRKMIKGPGGAAYAKKWVAGCPRFTYGEKVSLTLGITFGFKDPGEFSVAKYTYDKTTYQIYGWFYSKISLDYMDRGP